MSENNVTKPCIPLLTWEEERKLLVMSALVGSMPFAIILAFLYFALMGKEEKIFFTPSNGFLVKYSHLEEIFPGAHTVVSVYEDKLPKILCI
mgnify:CR=1 FL=1